MIQFEMCATSNQVRTQDPIVLSFPTRTHSLLDLDVMSITSL